MEDSQSVEAHQVKEDKFSSYFVYILTTLTSAIGFGNIWRFPYLVYTYGGLTFILAYIVVSIVATYPIMILEIGIGQCLRGGQMESWALLGKRTRAAGLTTWISFNICLFYPLLAAWSILFFVNSFDSTFRWSNPVEWKSECEALLSEANCNTLVYCEWRSTYCSVDSLYNSRVFFRETLFAFNDFNDRDRNISLSEFSVSPMLGLLVTWIFVGLCVFASAKIMGYTAYITMTLPIICLLIMVIISALLDGASDGVADYIGKFKINELSAQAFVDALSQSLFSVSLGQGVITALSSHNDCSTSISTSSMIIIGSDSLFSLLSGFAIFSILGFLAKQSKVSIVDLPLNGISLAFTAFPAAIAQMSGFVSRALSIIFFFTLWVLGFSTLVTLVEAIVLTIFTSRLGQKLRLKRWSATIIFTAFFFLIPGMLLSTNLGLAMLDSIDNYSAISQSFGAGMQGICIGWIYLSNYKERKTGKLAMYTHAVTFFLGPLFLGIFDKINAIAAIMLGLCIPIFGFFLTAYFLSNKIDEDGTVLSYTDKLYYLSAYNVSPIRKLFNDTSSSTGWSAVPKAWLYAIKYVVPYITIYLTVTSLTNNEKMYARPSPDAPYPWYIFLIGQFSPFLLMLSMIITLIWPSIVLPFVPRKKDFETSYVYGENLIHEFDCSNLKKIRAASAEAHDTFA